MKRMRGRREVWAAALALAFGAGPEAWAESPELRDPFYPNLRYTDTYGYLADPAVPRDFFDRFKLVPIAATPFGLAYFSVGGELRERFEAYRNQNFGIKAPAEDHYDLQRAQINFDVHVNDYIRTFVQLGDDRIFGVRGVTSTTDTDRLDVNQAFVDLRLPAFSGITPTFRYGREELVYGYQRLIAVREGPNVRRDFEGFQFTGQIGEAALDVIDVRPLVNAPGPMGDYNNVAQRLSGAYFTTPLLGALKGDFYLLNYQNTSAKFRGVSGAENRQTLGVRLFGAANGFDWNFEAATQTGTFASMDVRANMLAGIAGYTFGGVLWTPRIAVSSNYASGDNAASHTIGTFNAMYPRLPYFAETSMLVPANIADVRPVLELLPARDVLVVLGWDNLWRASSTDGLYGSGLNEYTNSNKSISSRVGTEISADVRWQVDRHLSLGAIAAELIAGPAVQQALGKTINFYVVYAKYKF